MAVDQLVRDLHASMADAVLAALEALEGVDVEAFRPVPRRPEFDGPLELVEALVRRDPAEVLQTLVDVLEVGDWVPGRWDLRPSETAVAVAPLTESGEPALLVVRRQGPDFRRREVRVLAAMALVAGRLSGAGSATA